MKKLLYKSIFLFIIIIISANSSRVKRKIVFRKNSKFFLRLNGKEPVLPFTTIFQHGWGFRMNWEMPDSIPKLHKMYQRDVSDNIAEYFARPELQELFCILKYYSNMIKKVDFSKECGVLCGIKQIIDNYEGQDLEFYKTMFNNLQYFEGDCPNEHYFLVPSDEL